MRPIIAKLTVFVVACVLGAVLVVNTLTDPLPGPKDTYHAVFDNAYGLTAGSHVTIAGVAVGRVQELRLEGGRAHTSFTVAADKKIPADAHAAIRYADLLGSRHLAVTRPPDSGSATKAGAPTAAHGGTTNASGQDAQLRPGATIPMSRTEPPLDLTALFNGFKPLFKAIDPGQVNQLARTIVDVFQGEGAAIEQLLSTVVSVTADVNGNEKTLDRLLTNLNGVLGTMNNHTQDFEALIGSIEQLTSYGANHRADIAAALDSGTKLAGSLNTLLAGIQPNLSQDIASLKNVSSTLVGNTEEFNTLMNETPELLNTLGRVTDQGSWANVYVCNLRLSIIGGESVNLSPGPHSEVCR